MFGQSEKENVDSSGENSNGSPSDSTSSLDALEALGAASFPKSPTSRVNEARRVIEERIDALSQVETPAGARDLERASKELALLERYGIALLEKRDLISDLELEGGERRARARRIVTSTFQQESLLEELLADALIEGRERESFSYLLEVAEDVMTRNSKHLSSALAWLLGDDSVADKHLLLRNLQTSRCADELLLKVHEVFRALPDAVSNLKTSCLRILVMTDDLPKIHKSVANAFMNSGDAEFRVVFADLIGYRIKRESSPEKIEELYEVMIDRLLHDASFDVKAECARKLSWARAPFATRAAKALGEVAQTTGDSSLRSICEGSLTELQNRLRVQKATFT